MTNKRSTPTLRPRFPLRWVNAIVVLALLATACGAADDGGADATTTTVPSVTSSNPPESTPPVPQTGSDEDDTDAGSTPGTGFIAETLAPGSVVSGDAEGPIEPALAPLVQKAIADLSVRLGVPEADISVLRAELVVWPDSSRGCPQPDMSYLMVLTDGVWIVLAHGSAVYEYRTDRTGTVFLCESAIKQRPVEGKAPGFGDS